MPDAMVIDLDLGVESGFELVRFWHGTPQLKPIAVVIWAMMEQQERFAACLLFTGLCRSMMA
jgi:CheY-like chemotaxis protein